VVTLGICDPNSARRAQLEATLRNGLPAPLLLRLRIVCFSTQRAFLNASKRKPFDLYLLDTGDSSPVGLSIAQELRNRDDQGCIIFVSNTPEHALAAFDVRAHHYFLRPVDELRLCDTVDAVLSAILSARKQAVSIKTHTSSEHIHLDDILYAELVGRTVRYNLIDGQKLDTVTMRVNFAEAVAPLLTQEQFSLSGASYAVNLHYIQAISKEGIQFINGVFCSPPKKSLSQLREKWLHYWQSDRLTGEECEKQPHTEQI